MDIYFAPLEGVTGYIYRNAYETFYGKGQINKYFIPFLSPNKTHGFTARETADILPEHNEHMPVVVQILANNATYFIDTVQMLYDKGYNEVNVNLGCPSGTVVSKFRGAGFLAIPNELEQFLEDICNSPLLASGKVKCSVKTRLGMEHAEEFYPLLEMYNRYPLEEVIIHPRVQKDYYKNVPNKEVFRDALRLSVHPVCYNGNLFTMTDYQMFREEFPEVSRVMLGRGLIANPALLWAMRGIEQDGAYVRDAAKEKATLKQFHNRVYQDYLKIMSGDKNAIHKMKELWIYQKHNFSDCEKSFKKIKKAQKMADYESAVTEFFAVADIVDKEHYFI